MPTLVEVIAEVAASVQNLAKAGHNEEQGYNFLRAIDVFDAIRGKLFARGVLIIPTGQSIQRSKPYETARGDMTDEVIGEFRFEIRGHGEVISCCAPGVGQDYQGKALYMASTGAKKDMLKTIFLLAGLDDDAETMGDTAPVNSSLGSAIAEMEKTFGKNTDEWTIDPIQQRNAWTAAARKTGYSASAQKKYLKKYFGVDKISDLKRKDFDRAMQWATGQMEIEENGSNDSLSDED